MEKKALEIAADAGKILRVMDVKIFPRLGGEREI